MVVQVGFYGYLRSIEFIFKPSDRMANP